MAKRYYLFVLLALALVLTATPCPLTRVNPQPTPTQVQPTCASGNITADGSSAIAGLVQQVAQSYQGQCQSSNPGITVNSSQSLNGLNELTLGNSVQIADSDVFTPPNMNSLVTDHQVAIGIFAMIINPQVTGVNSLTASQIRGIYSGKITNWNEVGGPNQQIYPLCRVSGSGTRQTFDIYVLGPTFPPYICDQKQTTSDVLANYMTIPGAIGYDILGIALQDQQQGKLKIISIDGYAPTPSSNIENGSYHFWNIEHMYTLKNPPALAQALIDYMSTSTAQSIITNDHFLNIGDVPANVIQAQATQETQ